MKRIGFIGAGKVGNSLGRYFTESFKKSSKGQASGSKDSNGLALSGYYSKSISSAKEAAEFTSSKSFESIDELIKKSDIIFVTVPDGSISAVWTEIFDTYVNSPFERFKLFCHCSGSLTSELFHDVEIVNAMACSFHPIFAVADKQNSYKELHKAYFTFEGSDQAYNEMSDLLASIENPVDRIAANKKTLYHIACVFFSNLVVGLANDGEEIFRLCGLDEEFAKNAWRALFLDNAINVSNKGPSMALTGPAERGDTSTIITHLDSLKASGNQDTLDTYRLLTKSIVEIAKRRHPERNYSEIDSLLNSALQD